MGVYRFDGKSWTSFTTENGLPGKSATIAVFDRNGLGWFVLDTGLFSFDGRAWTSWNEDVRNAGSGGITCIAADRNNVVWFGTKDTGLLAFDGAAWRRYTTEDGLTWNSILSLAVDHDNVLWVGTSRFSQGLGLSSFDGKTWKTHPQTLFRDYIGIVVDKDNIKWMISSHSDFLLSYDGVSWNSWFPPWQSDLVRYRSIAIDRDGNKWLGTKSMGAVRFRESGAIPSSVRSRGESPRALAILGNRPNPFNPSTTIEFTLPEAGRAELAVYDITGRKVRTLVSGFGKNGKYATVWDGRDDDGQPVASGIYLARLVAGKTAITRKMALVR
jgi:ligand-binding sensor domain-containing protein